MLKALFRGAKLRFFPVLPVEQGSGPSIALAETGSGKLALLGGNRRALVDTHSGSAPLNRPVVGA